MTYYKKKVVYFLLGTVSILLSCSSQEREQQKADRKKLLKEFDRKIADKNTKKDDEKEKFLCTKDECIVLQVQNVCQQPIPAQKITILDYHEQSLTHTTETTKTGKISLPLAFQGRSIVCGTLTPCKSLTVGKEATITLIGPCI